MSILVTGGTGFIGSHTCVELLNAGYDVVILDNLCNSKKIVLERINELTGKHPTFYKCDIRNSEQLVRMFQQENIEAVIHFAGLKAVGESVQKPLEYYDNNIGGTVTLLNCMKAFGVKKIVFSSSATVYGEHNESPLKEDMKTGGTTNPYGTTKYYIEQILEDVYKADNEWCIERLRYFNPIGAYESGRIGEDPSGIPNNLMPYITQVAIGKRPYLNVFGDDYDTHDGTGVRDYIHVVDLARGHIKAVAQALENTGLYTYNLGTGVGYSVLDVVHAFEKAYGKELPYKIMPRRPGDLATVYSDPSKAKEKLGWEAEYGIERMCEDSWRWQKNNPKGYV